MEDLAEILAGELTGRFLGRPGEPARYLHHPMFFHWNSATTAFVAGAIGTTGRSRGIPARVSSRRPATATSTSSGTWKHYRTARGGGRTLYEGRSRQKRPGRRNAAAVAMKAHYQPGGKERSWRFTKGAFGLHREGPRRGLGGQRAGRSFVMRQALS